MKIFDSHFHIIDYHYPIIENNGFKPEPFTCDAYLAKMPQFNIVGGAIVSGSFQEFDQTYLLAALKKLGLNFVGVTQLPMSVSEETIINLHQHGVRAVRFNLYRGITMPITDIVSLGQRVFEIAGWHSEFYIDSRELPNLFPYLTKLPVISIDHLGLFKDGFTNVLKLVEKGAYVCACGFSRVDMDVASAIRQIVAINPECLIFGTDLPSTRAPREFQQSDIDLVINAVGAALAQKIFYENGRKLYKLREQTSDSY